MYAAVRSESSVGFTINMKCFIAISAVFVIAFAEPPVSKSYLPPPPGKAGFSQGSGLQAGPQIIAARNLDQGNGLARNSQDLSNARFASNGEGYDSAALGRQAFEATSEPANYNFGYMVNDFNEGTDFGHHEERLEETARGEYHVVLPDGRKQTVSYKADERGFKPQISYQETEDLSQGYDANANSRSHNSGYHDNGVQGRNGHEFGSHDSIVQGRNSHEVGNHDDVVQGKNGHHEVGDNGFQGAKGRHENGIGHHGNGFNGGFGNNGNARSGY